jgi:murein DD-endopeptidase MepM/ murein hydrolase activator NlpD
MQQTSRRRVLFAAFAAALVLAPAAGAWSWPADGPVLQPFVFDPAHPYAAGQHRGIDLGAEAGTVVVAPAPGTVSFAGTVPASGRSLTITTADGYAVTLTHLGSFSVAAGASVAEGDPVGTIGPSGEPELAQPYVHLGIRLAAAPEGYVDPLTLLPPKQAAGPPVSPAAAGLAPVPGRPAVPAASDPAPPAPSPGDAAPTPNPSVRPFRPYRCRTLWVPLLSRT